MNIVKTEFFRDDEIILKKNNRIINAKFGDLIDTKFNFLNSEILTLNENKELCWYNINQKLEEILVDTDLVKIETKNGYVCVFPLNTTFFKSDSTSIDNINLEKVENIRINDFIPVIKNIPLVNNSKIIKITDYIYEKNSNDFIYDYVCPNDNKIKNSIKLDSIFVKFIAFYLSFGYIKEYDVIFELYDVDSLDEFDKTINQFTRNMHINFSKYDRKYIIKSNILSKFMNFVMNVGSNKNILIDVIDLFDLEIENRYLLNDFLRILFLYCKEKDKHDIIYVLNSILKNDDIDCFFDDEKLYVNNNCRNVLKSELNHIELFNNICFYIKASDYINFDYIDNDLIFKHEIDFENGENTEVSHARDFSMKNNVLLKDEFIWFISNYCINGKIARVVDKNLKLFGKKYINIFLNDENKLRTLSEIMNFDYKKKKDNEYYIISDILVEFINKLVGDTIESKKIPEFIFDLNGIQKKIFLEPFLIDNNFIMNENIRFSIIKLSKDLFDINAHVDSDGKLIIDKTNLKKLNENEDTRDNILISKYVNKINYCIPNKIIKDDLFSCFLGIFYSIGVINEDKIEFKIEKDDFELDVNFKNFVERYNLENTKVYFNSETIASYFYYFTDKNADIDKKYLVYSISNDIFLEFMTKMRDEFDGLPKFIFEFDKFFVKVFLKNWIKYKGYLTSNVKILEDISLLLKYFNVYSIVKNDKLLINKRYKYIIEEIYPLCEMDLFNDKDDYEFINDKYLNEQYTIIHNRFYDQYGNNTNENNEIEIVKTYNELYQIIRWYEKKSEKHNNNGLNGHYINSKEDLKYFYKIYDSNIYMDKIIKIELIENKDIKYLYKLN